MLRVSGLLGSSGDAAATAGAAPEGGGGSGSSGGAGGAAEMGAVGSNSGGFSEDERGGRGGAGEEGDRSSAGNRWPRQETLALLKIRSDMDVAFRDSSLKGPLWDEVSRKLAELGYHRSAKKCKEKFENVYKYHKRTKEGRASKADGKTYRFFDQLEALDSHFASLPAPPPQPQQQPQQQQQQPQQRPQAVATPQPLPAVAPTHNLPIISQITVTSTATNAVPQNAVAPASTTISPLNQSPMQPQPQPQQHQQARAVANPVYPSHHQVAHSTRASTPIMAANLISSNSTSSSSSTSSDETLDEGGGDGSRKRKRKWKDFFERLMRDVIHKQEDLQRKFLEAIEKRERDRMVREEAWRMQEMARMNREHEILVQERSIAAAKDAALISFLQKMSSSDPQNPIQVPPVPDNTVLQVSVLPQSTPPPPQQPQPQQQPVVVHQQQQAQPSTPPAIISSTMESAKNNSMMIVENVITSTTPSTSSSRWPKTEVQALIKLRTDLDVKYQENGPKGPLWEEISAGMRRLGYSRSAKRCKEKWENINKYFKKVKESNKKRPEDSKTCPYFHQLDALYREKNRIEGTSSAIPAPTTPSSVANLNPGYAMKPGENVNVNVNVMSSSPMVPLMVRPEQQWPPMIQNPAQEQQQQQQNDSTAEDIGSENMDQNLDDDDDGDDDDDDDDGDEEDEGGGYEIVTNKKGSSMATAGGE